MSDAKEAWQLIHLTLNPGAAAVASVSVRPIPCSALPKTKPGWTPANGSETRFTQALAKC